MKSESFLKISDEAEIDRPAGRHFMPLEWKDWDRIKKGVGQINNNSNYWENSAWAFTAFSFTLALQYIIEYGRHLPDTARGTFFLMGALFCCIIAAICFLVSHVGSKSLGESRGSVLDDMQTIEKYIKDSQ